MLDPLLLLILLSLIICAIGLSWFAGTDAPYIPTDLKKIKPLLKLVKAKKGKIFYELGSGDGRVVVSAAKLGAQSIGIEQSWIRVWGSRIKARKMRLPNAQFYHGNLFQRQYYPADIVFIYLLTKAVLKLEKKLLDELKKGALVITQTYHFQKWKPVKKMGDFWIYIR